MRNEALKKAMTALDNEASAKKTKKHTGDHLFGPKQPQLETAKSGFHSFATTRNARVLPSTCRKAYLNPWSSITGIGLLTPSMSRNTMRQLIQHGNVTEEDQAKFKQEVDLANAVHELQQNTEKDQMEAPFCFPDEEYEFDMAEAVKTSIRNYKKAKNEYGMMAGTGDKYSSILRDRA